jgi:predicted AAA+ superfamily ATPase
VVLLDELVVYIRQFVESQALSGGTYDSNLSFIQSLTEAAKLVPNAVVLASLAGIEQPSRWSAWCGGAAVAGSGL